MRWLIHSSLYAAAAVVILYVITPFLPTYLLIQPIDLEIEDGVMGYTRTVTVPTIAKHQTEVTQGRMIFPECNATGSTLFEVRDHLEPVEWKFPCTLPYGEYDVSVCVTASFWGIDMQPACLTEEWVVGPEPVELKEQLRMIQRQVEILQMEVQSK